MSSGSAQGYSGVNTSSTPSLGLRALCAISAASLRCSLAEQGRTAAAASEAASLARGTELLSCCCSAFLPPHRPTAHIPLTSVPLPRRSNSRVAPSHHSPLSLPALQNRSDLMSVPIIRGHPPMQYKATFTQQLVERFKGVVVITIVVATGLHTWPPSLALLIVGCCAGQMQLKTSSTAHSMEVSALTFSVRCAEQQMSTTARCSSRSRTSTRIRSRSW